jgi:hypothetical protein
MSWISSSLSGNRFPQAHEYRGVSLLRPTLDSSADRAPVPEEYCRLTLLLTVDLRQHVEAKPSMWMPGGTLHPGRPALARE